MPMIMALPDLPKLPAQVRIVNPVRREGSYYEATGGTGYLYQLVQVSFTSSTGAVPYQRGVPANVVIPLAPSGMIEQIRNVFHLNVTQTAKVLRVERPTIYLWSSMTTSNGIKKENSERLQKIYLASIECKKYEMPIDALKWQQADGSTLLDILSGEKVSTREIVNTWHVLRNAKTQMQEMRKERGKAFATAVASAIASLGDKEELKKEIFRESPNKTNGQENS